MFNKVNISILNAPEDQKYKETLIRHLKPLSPRTSIWHDGEIAPGEDWKKKTDQEMKKAEVIIFIISVNFINSGFIETILNKIFDNSKYILPNTRIIPIIVSPCLWEEAFSKNINNLKVLPNNQIPVSIWGSSENAWVEIVTGIKAVINSMEKPNSVGQNDKKENSPPHESLPLEDEVFVGGGVFKMGPRNNPHNVNIKGFFIGKYLVTFADYDQYCEEENLPKPSDENWGRGRCPAINVNWFDAINYCNWLSKRYGLPLAYEVKGDSIHLISNSIGFRLPTESEWEYAAAEGKPIKPFMYSGSNKLDDVSWHHNHYKNTNIKRTMEVGRLKANALNLYDMSGNVWEWCEDDWHININDIPEDGTAYKHRGSRKKAVKRGGSHYITSQYCLIDHRAAHDKNKSDNEHGFRVVRSAETILNFSNTQEPDYKRANTVKVQNSKNTLVVHGNLEVKGNLEIGDKK